MSEGPADVRLADEPLVLLHGVGSSAAAWDPVMSLLRASHHVLAMDLPGFGDAPPLPIGQRASIPAHADVVARRLDAEGIRSAHVVGNSSGGWLALELARRGRGRSVVALSPAGMWRGWEKSYVFASLNVAHSLARLAAPAADNLMRIKPLRLALWQYFAHPTRLGARQAAEAIRAMGDTRSFHDLTAWTYTHAPVGLDEIDCPVLIAWGAKDRLLFGSQAERFVAAIPGAELRRPPGAGHVPMADDPELVASTILGFVERSRLTAPRAA
jgi:pimeloyl-ACP methyl ester carboxylesterase